MNEQSLQVAEESGDAVGQAMATLGLCRLEFRAHDFEEGRRLTARARQLGAGDAGVEVRAVHMEAEMLRAEARYAQAVPLYEENIERWRTLGNDHGITMELYNLGCVLALAGRHQRARELIREALGRARAASDSSMQMYCVAGLGGAIAADDPAGGLRLIAAARAAAAAAGVVFDPAESEELERFEAEARSRLAADAAAAQLAEGSALPLDAAVAEALAHG